MKPRIALFSLLAIAMALPRQASAKLPSSSTEDLYALKALKRYPYVGGNLQYMDGNTTMSHLKVGAKIPVRFGKLNKIPIPASQLPSQVLTNPGYTGQVFFESEDNKTLTKYGYLTITGINVSNITFSYYILKLDGSVAANASKSLALNATADLDGDGKADVQYLNQINAARPANAYQRYLSFLSNETTQYTTAYCYLPENLPSLSWVGGNLGFNPAGNAIIRPTKTTALAKSSVTAGTQVETGDLVMDLDAGTYRKVSTSMSGALSKGSATMTTVISQSTLVSDYQDIFPVAHVATSEVSFALAKTGGVSSPFKVYLDEAEYQSEVAYYDAKANSYLATLPFPSFDIPAADFDGLAFGVDKIKITVAVDADADVTWSRAKASMSGMIIVKAEPTMTATKEVKLAGKDYKLLNKNFGKVPIPIGPLQFNLSIASDIGLETKVYVAAKSKAATKMFLATGFTTSVSIGWTSATGSNDCFFKAGLYPVLDVKSGLEAGAYIRPYFEMGPRLDLYGVLYAQVTARKAIGPSWTTTLEATTPEYAVTNIGFYQTRNLVLKAGADIGIKFLGIKFYKNWEPVKFTLATQTDPLGWSTTIRTPLTQDPVTGTKSAPIATTGARVVVSKFMGGSIVPILGLLTE